MSDGTENAPRTTAGALLRAAREKQGLHIAALAASIKVAPRKLDALEHDRYDELPDATFTRALAQTVCRTLKIDPQPVLALLPAVEPSALDHVSTALNEPFRERPGRSDPSGLAVAAIRPMVWAGVLLLAAAAAVYFVPTSVWQPAPAALPVVAAASAPEPAVPAPTPAPELAALPPSTAPVTADAPASAPAGDPVFVPPPAPPAASAPGPTPAPAQNTLVQVRAEAASWVEVRDARGEVLLSRTVLAGESVGIDGALPIRMTIGNAPATRVSFRGKPVDLAASTRDTVARIELQ